MAEPTNDSPKDENRSESNVEATNDTLENRAVVSVQPEASKDDSTPEEGLNHPSQTDTSSEGQALQADDEDHLLEQTEGIFLLWWNWAYFEMKVEKPIFTGITPPRMLMPEKISGTQEVEFVYPICDFGHTLSTSKASEMFSVGMSMCKLYYTIEKMIFILVERLKEGGVDPETGVQVMFEGHLLSQRKAFESIINLRENVLVTNFDPGIWGEQYLEIVKRMADRGYGYPPEAPRTLYKLAKTQSAPAKQSL